MTTTTSGTVGWTETFPTLTVAPSAVMVKAEAAGGLPGSRSSSNVKVSPVPPEPTSALTSTGPVRSTAAVELLVTSGRRPRRW